MPIYTKPQLKILPTYNQARLDVARAWIVENFENKNDKEAFQKLYGEMNNFLMPMYEPDLGSIKRFVSLAEYLIKQAKENESKKLEINRSPTFLSFLDKKLATLNVFTDRLKAITDANPNFVEIENLCLRDDEYAEKRAKDIASKPVSP